MNEAAPERSECRDRTGCRACGAEIQEAGRAGRRGAGEENSHLALEAGARRVVSEGPEALVWLVPKAHGRSGGRMGWEAFEGQILF